MHGATKSATPHFFEDSFAEPSLSRTQKLVEHQSLAAEEILHNQILRSAKLLLYHSSELLASHHAGDMKRAGLDYRLYKQLVNEAEKLVLSTEMVISELRFARRSLSRLFKWFKTLHPDKNGTLADLDADAPRSRLKSHELQHMANLLQVPMARHEAIYSKTEAIMDLAVSRLLSKSNLMSTGSSIVPPVPSDPGPSDIASQIADIASQIVEKSSDGGPLRSFSQRGHEPDVSASSGDDWCTTKSIILSSRLEAVSLE